MKLTIVGIAGTLFDIPFNETLRIISIRLSTNRKIRIEGVLESHFLKGTFKLFRFTIYRLLSKSLDFTPDETLQMASHETFVTVGRLLKVCYLNLANKVVYHGWTARKFIDFIFT